MIDIKAECEWLEENHASMPVPVLQARRGAALKLATKLYNAEAEKEPFNREAHDAIYDIVLRLDRIGY